MALCCQNRVCKGTNQRYGLRVSASISVHRTSVTVLGLLKKKELVQNRVVAVFRLATQNTLTVVINGFDRSGYTPVCCMSSYLFLRVTLLQWSLSRFMCNTLIEAAILKPDHSYVPTY